MDELEISGKRYISSRRAAKDHKYHPDYIGQLVRAGKIPGQKVGRAWYVEAAATAAYFDSEESVSQISAVEEVEPAAPASPVVMEEVPTPVVTKEEMKKEETAEEAHFQPIHIHLEKDEEIPDLSSFVEEEPLEKPTSGGLRYIVDDSALFPIVRERGLHAIADLPSPTNSEEEEPVYEAPKKNKRSSSMLLNLALILGVIVIIGAVALATTTQEVLTVAVGQASKTGYANDFSNSASILNFVK